MTLRSLLKSALVLSLAALVLNIGRLGLADNLSYLWLNWNLFLAIIPIILFAWVFTRAKNSYIQLISFLLWLGFLPNAPYIVTDLIHLADVGPRAILWYDAVMIFIYTLAGMLAWIGTTHLIQKKMQWNEWFIIIVGILSGFGLYLGRYIRFNTWDVIVNPLNLFQTVGEIILSPMNHQPVILIVGVFTFLLFVLNLILNNITIRYDKN